MIIRKLPDGSMIMIGQTDHAKLSGLIAAHWGNKEFARPEPYGSAVRAAMMHDAGWFRYEVRPLFDAESGSTPSFMQVPLDRNQLGAFQWATDWLGDIDPYAGALINKHRTGLWRGRYGSIDYPVVYNAKDLSPELEAFIERNEAQQQSNAATIDPAQFEVNYRLLQAWDFLSLYFCAKDPVEDHIEFVPQTYADKGKEGVRLNLTPLGDNRIKIDPYPFDIRPLEVGLIYRHLPAQTFASEEDFHRAYYGTAPTLKTYIFE